MTQLVVRFSTFAAAFLLLLAASRYALGRSQWQWDLLLLICALFCLGLAFLGSKRLRLQPNAEEEEPPKPSPVQATIPTNTKQLNYQKISELGLSKREYEVLQWMAQKLSNKAIADKLSISEHTVKAHVSSILVKMSVARRAEAVKLAKEWGIL